MEEEAMKVLDSALSHIKWRLKSQAKHRLQIDIVALLTEMRPVVMVDYGGKLPELQDHLCALVKFCHQEAVVFEHLRVMVIEDMIYLIHVKGLAEYVKATLNSEIEFLFVNLEEDPPKMVTRAEESTLVTELVRVQNLFSSFFPLDGRSNNISSHRMTDAVLDAKSSIDKPVASQSSEFIDLSCCMQDTEVTVPTLNGWLLGYPVVYLFSKQHIEDAIYNLSTKFLHIFQVLVSRNSLPNKRSQPEELMSFSVPYELSMGGSNESWAESFLFQMQSKWEKCKQTWRYLKMEVSECYPQAIVLASFLDWFYLVLSSSLEIRSIAAATLIAIRLWKLGWIMKIVKYIVHTDQQTLLNSLHRRLVCSLNLTGAGEAVRSGILYGLMMQMMTKPFMV